MSRRADAWRRNGRVLACGKDGRPQGGACARVDVGTRGRAQAGARERDWGAYAWACEGVECARKRAARRDGRPLGGAYARARKLVCTGGQDREREN